MMAALADGLLTFLYAVAFAALAGLAVFGGQEWREVAALCRWMIRNPPWIPARARAGTPARAVGTTARRTPPGVETRPATGTVPGLERARSSPPGPGTAVHPRFGPLLGTPPGGIRVDLGGHVLTVGDPEAPVYDQLVADRAAGRHRHALPLHAASPTHPPWLTAPQPAVDLGDWWGHLPPDPGDIVDSPIPHSRPYLARHLTRADGRADLGPASPRPFAERVRTL